MTFFSAKTLGFYNESMRQRYKDAGTWPDDVIEMTKEEKQTYQGVQPPNGKRLGADGQCRPVWVDIPSPPQEEIDFKKAKSEHGWVKSELDTVTIELMYHWTGDHRASHTEQVWKDYAISLRDYTSTDDDGNPVIVGESRPSIEDFI